MNVVEDIVSKLKEVQTSRSDCKDEWKQLLKSFPPD